MSGEKDFSLHTNLLNEEFYQVRSIILLCTSISPYYIDYFKLNSQIFNHFCQLTRVRN